VEARGKLRINNFCLPGTLGEIYNNAKQPTQNLSVADESRYSEFEPALDLLSGFFYWD
jgi:hypothetical protein